MAKFVDENKVVERAQNVIIKRADVFQLIRQNRCPLRDAGFDATADLAGQPGPTLRAPSHHDGVGA